MLEILIIDDEAPIREWLTFCINKFDGYKVIGTASHGAEGYSIFKKTMPDIVFTDIKMPIMNGLEVMEAIKNLNVDIFTIVLTSHVDFEYARKTFKLGAAEYILKTEISEKVVGELLEKGKKTLNLRKETKDETLYERALKRNNFLKSLILKDGNAIVNNEILKRYDIFFDKDPIFVLDIYFKTDNHIENKILIPKINSINNIIKFQFDFNHLFIIGNIQGSNSRKDQQNKCMELCNKILKEYSCTIGISDIFDNIYRLRKALIQAHHRVSLEFYSNNERVFAFQTNIVLTPSNGERLKAKFTKELIKQNYSEVITIKNKLKEEISLEKPIDVNYIKKLYSFIITSIIHVTNENIELIEENIKKTNENIIQAQNFSDLNILLEKSFGVLNNAYKYENSTYSLAIRNAIKYMNENYRNSINLTDVANTVSLSPEYLSRLFKDETGINFIVYLNNIRLRQAVKMLENSNLKVYEIADIVGYSNLSYFSTVFKKNFGINPFEYRNKFSK
ncbi:MAG: response regulator [Lachnospirales bacterium]